MDPDRQYAVASLLFDYLKSPSLRHLREPHSVHKLARDIVNALDRASSIWTKWEPDRGTEMRAIIGALQEHIEREEERLRVEQQERYRRWKEEERVKLEQRFLSGADCGWTRIEKSEAFYCRRNGRAFCIIQGKDKRWTLYRVKEIGDKGELLGTYQGRGDANEALRVIAYAPQPRY